MQKLPIFDCEAIETRLLTFIKKEMTSAGFTKVVLGLSGDLDSAVSAALAVKALGKEHVTALLMLWKTSSQKWKDFDEIIKSCEIILYGRGENS